MVKWHVKRQRDARRSSNGWAPSPFESFDAAGRSRLRVRRMWALRRSRHRPEIACDFRKYDADRKTKASFARRSACGALALKSLADAKTSAAFFASYLIRIASHHFTEKYESSTCAVAPSYASLRRDRQVLSAVNHWDEIAAVEEGGKRRKMPGFPGLLCVGCASGLCKRRVSAAFRSCETSGALIYG